MQDNKVERINEETYGDSRAWYGYPPRGKQYPDEHGRLPKLVSPYEDTIAEDTCRECGIGLGTYENREWCEACFCTHPSARRKNEPRSS